MATIPEDWIRRLAAQVGNAVGASTELTTVVGRVRRAPAGARSKTTCLQLVVAERRGAAALRSVGDAIEVRWGDGSSTATAWRMTVGRSPGNPAWFHNRIHAADGPRSDPGPATTAALLDRHGYRVGDAVRIELDPATGTASIATRSGATENPSADGRLPLERDHSLQVPSIEPRFPKRALTRAPAMLRRYNRGRYLGRANVDLDAEGYRRFARGPAPDLDTLTDDLAFVGRYYGGTKVGLLPEGSWEVEARRIAAQMIEDRDTYRRLVRRARPLAETIPAVKTTLRLIEPFHASRSWMVWATKTLHFLAPTTFPQLDAAVEAALGLTRNSYEAHYYVGYMAAYRSALERFAPILPELRRIDRETRGANAPVADLKLLDKVLYELGRMRSG